MVAHLSTRVDCSFIFSGTMWMHPFKIGVSLCPCWFREHKTGGREFHWKIWHRVLSRPRVDKYGPLFRKNRYLGIWVCFARSRTDWKKGGFQVWWRRRRVCQDTKQWSIAAVAGCWKPFIEWDPGGVVQPDHRTMFEAYSRGKIHVRGALSNVYWVEIELMEGLD